MELFGSYSSLVLRMPNRSGKYSDLILVESCDKILIHETEKISKERKRYFFVTEVKLRLPDRLIR
jgi:hypothetical protein